MANGLRPLSAREKEIYSLLCRKIRFPLVAGHVQGSYLALNQALKEIEELRKDRTGEENVTAFVSKETAQLLARAGIYCLRSLKRLRHTDIQEIIQDKLRPGTDPHKIKRELVKLLHDLRNGLI